MYWITGVLNNKNSISIKFTRHYIHFINQLRTKHDILKSGKIWAVQQRQPTWYFKSLMKAINIHIIFAFTFYVFYVICSMGSDSRFVFMGKLLSIWMITFRTPLHHSTYVSWLSYFSVPSLAINAPSLKLHLTFQHRGGLTFLTCSISSNYCLSRVQQHRNVSGWFNVLLFLLDQTAYSNDFKLINWFHKNYALQYIVSETDTIGKNICPKHGEKN